MEVRTKNGGYVGICVDDCEGLCFGCRDVGVLVYACICLLISSVDYPWTRRCVYIYIHMYVSKYTQHVPHSRGIATYKCTLQLINQTHIHTHTHIHTYIHT